MPDRLKVMRRGCNPQLLTIRWLDIQIEEYFIDSFKN